MGAFGILEASLHLEVVGRAVEQLAIVDEAGGLAQPGGIPEAGDFAPRPATGASTAIETVKGRG
jgi:hypothetical protein